MMHLHFFDAGSFLWALNALHKNHAGGHMIFMQVSVFSENAF